jgi:hypothetical protein
MIAVPAGLVIEGSPVPSGTFPRSFNRYLGPGASEHVNAENSKENHSEDPFATGWRPEWEGSYVSFSDICPVGAPGACSLMVVPFNWRISRKSCINCNFEIFRVRVRGTTTLGFTAPNFLRYCAYPDFPVSTCRHYLLPRRVA